MSELGVCNVDQLSIVKEIVEKRGMHHLSHKKSTCTKIWKYMFEQLSLGLERKNFRKEVEMQCLKVFFVKKKIGIY